MRVNLRCGRASLLRKVHCSYNQHSHSNILDKAKDTLSLKACDLTSTVVVVNPGKPLHYTLLTKGNETTVKD